MRQRILAILGAVGLVVVAVVVRGALAGDDDTGASGPDGGRRPVVACSPGVEAVCRALVEEGLIAADPPTVDLGSAGATTGVADDVEIDAWITWDPAGAMANFDAVATAGVPTWGEPLAVGSSDLAMLTDQDAVLSDCPPTGLTWSCALEAGSGGMAIAVGHPRTIDGVLRLYPLAASLLGADEGFETVELIPVVDLLDNQTQAGRTFRAEFNLYLTAQGTYQAIVGPVVALSARDGSAVIPTGHRGGDVSMNLVVTPRAGASTGWVERAFAREAVAEAVRATGVDPGSATLAGTPDPGDLYALQQELQP